MDNLPREKIAIQKNYLGPDVTQNRKMDYCIKSGQAGMPILP